jgi:hypothetical protein
LQSFVPHGSSRSLCDPALPRHRIRQSKCLRRRPDRPKGIPQELQPQRSRRRACPAAAGSRLLAIKGAIKFLLFAPNQRSNRSLGRRAGWTTKGRIRTELDNASYGDPNVQIPAHQPRSSLPGCSSSAIILRGARFHHRALPPPSASWWGIGAGGISCRSHHSSAPIWLASHPIYLVTETRIIDVRT